MKIDEAFLSLTLLPSKRPGRQRPDTYFNGRQYLFDSFGIPKVIVQGTKGVAPGTKWISGGWI